MTEIVTPFAQFFDTSGAPLNNGIIYIGAANLDAQTNPIPVYWDDALTIPAAQPIRTLNGYAVRNGTPARIFCNADNFSMTVQTSTGRAVWSVADATSVPTISNPTGSDLVGFIAAEAGAVPRTVQDRLRETLSVLDFGAVGDGIADDTAAIQAAINAGGRINLGRGTFRVTSPLNVLSNSVSLIGAGADQYGTAGTRILIDGNIDLFNVGSLSSPYIQEFECRDIWISGLGSLTSGRVFVLRNTANTHLANLTVTDFASFLYARKAYTTTIENVWCNVQRSGPNGYGIYWDGSVDRSDAMSLINFTFGNDQTDPNWPMNNRPNGIVLDGDVNTLRIQTCALVGVNRGILTVNTGSKPVGQQFNYLFCDGLEIDFTYQTSIELVNGNGFNFVNTYVNTGGDPANAMYIHSGVDEMSFKGGQIFGGQQHGIIIEGRNVSFIDCWMSGAGSLAVNTYDQVIVLPTAENTSIIGGYAGGLNRLFSPAGLAATRYGVRVDAGAKDTQLIGVNLKRNRSAGFASSAAANQLTVLGCPGAFFNISALQDYRVDPQFGFRVGGGGNDAFFDLDPLDYFYYDRGANIFRYVINGTTVSSAEQGVVKSLVPHQFASLSGDPAGMNNGTVYYNTSTNKLRVLAGGVWVDLH